MEKLVSTSRVFRLLASISLLLFVFNGIFSSSEPLIDLHGFRQTQTADSVFWMLHGYGIFHLTYPLPVIGSPWSAPFEFPAFQVLVAVLVKISGASITQTGRILSLLCSLALLHPTRNLFRRFNFSPNAFYIFIVLFYTAPQYLYWSRSFLIETFSLLIVIYVLFFYFRFVDFRRNRDFFFLIFLITLALIEKITTSLVVIILISSFECIRAFRSRKATDTSLLARTQLLVSIGFSFIIAQLWIHFTDIIKAKGAISSTLTSAKLVGWNFGTLGQRFSKNFWIGLVLEKNLLQNSLAFLGLILVFHTIIRIQRYRIVLCSLLFLWFMPMEIFTNLHIVHVYYQTENIIFLIAAISIALSETSIRFRKSLQLYGIPIALCLNVFLFMHSYLPYERLKSSGSDVIQIANFVERNTPVDSVLVTSGKDWDPTLAFYSKRYSVMVPDWYPDRFRFLKYDRTYLGAKRVGSFVICASNYPGAQFTSAEVAALAHRWTLAEKKAFGNCEVYFP